MQGFAALSDPTRRRIVEMLATRELPAGEIARRFDMTAPAVSQHLKLLRDAGLVHVRRDAQRRIYALDPGGLAELDAWLERFRRFWSPPASSGEKVLPVEPNLRGRKVPESFGRLQ